MGNKRIKNNFAIPLEEKDRMFTFALQLFGLALKEETSVSRLPDQNNINCKNVRNCRNRRSTV